VVKNQAGCARPKPNLIVRKRKFQETQENMTVQNAPIKKKFKRNIRGFVPKALFQDSQNLPIDKAVYQILDMEKNIGSDDVWPNDSDKENTADVQFIRKTTGTVTLPKAIVKREPLTPVKIENPEYVETEEEKETHESSTVKIEVEDKDEKSFTESEIDDMLKSSPKEETVPTPKINSFFQEKILDTEMITRLQEARHHYTMTGFSGAWKTVPLEVPLPNAYAKACNSIIWRLFGISTINLQQFKVLKKNYGHLVASTMATHSKGEMKQAYISLGRIPEVERNTSPPTCNKCRSHHFQDEKRCRVRLENQPVVGSMEATHAAKWKNKVKVVIIGFEILTSLPAYTLKDILNLGQLGRPDYQVLLDPNQMTKDWAENQDLFKTILRQLKLIGLDCSTPVLIEFTTSYDKSVFTSVWDHMVSFCAIIKYLQTMYCGPLIAIIPPTPHLSGFTTEVYTERKFRAQQMTQCLNMVGQAIGVGTNHIWVNSMIIPEGEMRHMDMRPYPLFNLAGAESAEYCRRLTAQILRIADSCGDILVGGARRRRGMTGRDLLEIEVEDSRIQRLETW